MRTAFTILSPRSAAKVAALRLLLAAIPLCSLTGVGAWYYETERMEQRVLEDSVRDANRVTAEDLSRYYAGAAGIDDLRAEARAALGEFVSIAIQDRAGNQIVREHNARSSLLPDAVWSRADAVRTDSEARYEKVGGTPGMTLITVVPIKAGTGEALGYVRGVYVVPDAVLAEMKEDAVGAVLIAVLTVLGSMSLVFPIILYMQKEHGQQTRKVLEGNTALLEVLGNAIAHRDSDTDEHNYRVTIYALELAASIGLPADQMRVLIVGAFLHDVGKIGISDSILLKQGKLTEQEFDVMKGHVAIGMHIVRSSPWLAEALPVVAHHHEKYDGSGYPNGLAGEAIPLVARIFAVADVFDALTTRRPYKEAIPVEAAIAGMLRESGRHFDPVLIVRFAEIARELYRETFGNSHETLRQILLGWIRGYMLEGRSSARGRPLLAATAARGAQCADPIPR
ncbi:MAG TPA: HD-GYP domain-containing protein [Rhodocyclaceae bacterium]